MMLTMAFIASLEAFAVAAVPAVGTRPDSTDAALSDAVAEELARAGAHGQRHTHPSSVLGEPDGAEPPVPICLLWSVEASVERLCVSFAGPEAVERWYPCVLLDVRTIQLKSAPQPAGGFWVATVAQSVLGSNHLCTPCLESRLHGCLDSCQVGVGFLCWPDPFAVTFKDLDWVSSPVTLSLDAVARIAPQLERPRGSLSHQHAHQRVRLTTSAVADAAVAEANVCVRERHVHLLRAVFPIVSRPAAAEARPGSFGTARSGAHRSHSQ